jgi:hypothetical protein
VPAAQENTQFLDCRDLTADQVGFVLSCLGPIAANTSGWRISHASPSLVAGQPGTQYRTNAGITAPDWFTAAADSLDPQVLEARARRLNPDVLMATLKAYVARNRLHEAFAEAARLLASVALAAAPESCESHMYYDHRPDVFLPAFAACRGRYSFLVEGTAAYITPVRLAEANMVLRCPELIYWVAMWVAHGVANGNATMGMLSAAQPTHVLDDSWVVQLSQPGGATSALLAACYGAGSPKPCGAYGVVHAGTPDRLARFTVVVIVDADVKWYDLVADAAGVRQTPVTYAALVQSPILPTGYNIPPDLAPLMAFTSMEFEIERRLTPDGFIELPLPTALRYAAYARIAGYDTRLMRNGTRLPVFAANGVQVLVVTPQPGYLDRTGATTLKVALERVRANTFWSPSPPTGLRGTRKYRLSLLRQSVSLAS